MVDLLYTCHNRKEFVKTSLQTLLDNTNWNQVASFTIYCDNCDEPVTEGFQLSGAHLRITTYGSIVAIMRDWIPRCEAPLLAKIDSDTMVPPGWLDACVDTLRVFPRVDLLGIEAYGDLVKYPSADIYNHTIRITDHIGGIGVFRRRVFERFPDLSPNPSSSTFYGFTEWQWVHPEMVKAWLDPALPVFLLDHLPFEPWKTLTDEYIAKGWMRRQWGQYETQIGGNPWDWWKKLK